jgi:hypothetical protein
MQSRITRSSSSVAQRGAPVAVHRRGAAVTTRALKLYTNPATRGQIVNW